MDRHLPPDDARALGTLTRTAGVAAIGVVLLAAAGCYSRVTGTRGVGSSGISTEQSDLEDDPVGAVLFGEPETSGRRERMSSWGRQRPAPRR